MIDSVDLVFAEKHPDLADPRTLHMLQDVVSHNSWVRRSAFFLGGLAIGLPLILYLRVYFPGLSIDGAAGRITPAGHVFFFLLIALGIAALRFGLRLHEDVAPYRIDAGVLSKLHLEEGEVAGFGPWLSAGGKYQRLRVRTADGRAFWTPYIRLTQAIWISEADTVHVAASPENGDRLLFLGVDRVAPDILKRGSGVGLRECRAALQDHLADAARKRRETL